MEKQSIISLIKEECKEVDGAATYLHTFSQKEYKNLLTRQIGNRDAKSWGKAQYIVIDRDDTDCTLADLLDYWKRLASTYNNQYMVLNTPDGTGWRIYDYNGNDLGKADAVLPHLFSKVLPVAGYSPYRPYITAIKSKPFLLLAGISGTGKSRIVRELARACWDEGSEEYKAQKPKNFEMVQVKPNWHDSSELIGYVSRVSGKAEFVAGDFLKFVAKAWENPDTPYFLCLDEMNLAPVEQYFAEYLSVVESRRCGEDGVVTTDPILKKEDAQ